MPNNTIIAEGKTTNEAIEKGLKILNVTKNMVNIKVLDSEKKSFFSILDPRVVKVELTLKEKEESNNVVINREKKELKTFNEKDLLKAENNIKIFMDQFINQINTNISYYIKASE